MIQDVRTSKALDTYALTDRVYEKLRSRIIDLQLAPGKRLNVGRLKEELGVSHTPIREALNRLVSERLVTVAPYRGFTVAPLLDADGVAQLLDARLVIEKGAIERAVTAIAPEQLAELNRVTAELDELAGEQILDVAAFNALDAKFHRLTIAASGNPFLLNAFDDLRVHIQLARYYRGRSVGDARQAQAEHRRLFAALSDRDADAALQAVVDHMHGVYDRLRTGAFATEEQAR